jgi:signal transduction histidine kinase
LDAPGTSAAATRDVVETLWRALAAFRVASLAYAGALVWQNAHNYAHPVAGRLVYAGMVVWTVLATALYAQRRLRRWPLLTLDFTLAMVAVSATRYVETAVRVRGNVPTLPVSWSVAPLLAWAIVAGVTGGVAAAVVHSVVTVAARGALPQSTFQSCVLLLLAGAVVGQVATLTRESAARLAAAVARESAATERARLARDIHDSVLQTLALVHRRGRELGGVGSELAELAARSESDLRSLVQREPGAPPTGVADLRAALADLAATRRSPATTFSGPLSPVLLPAAAVDSVLAAVAQSLDNVEAHAGAGANAWLTLEEPVGEVVVALRDDGLGMTSDRAERAAAEGRMGLARSIRGRIEELGGRVELNSAPGAGVEVEMRLPASLGATS